MCVISKGYNYLFYNYKDLIISKGFTERCHSESQRLAPV